MTDLRREQLAAAFERAALRTICGIKWLARNHQFLSLAVAFVLVMLSPIIGHAQGPPPGPITYGGYSDQSPLRSGKAVINLLMWFMFIVGVVLWCMVPILGPKKGNWFTYAAFGTVALGIGGWIALSHRIASGDTPELPDLMGR